jgi:cytoskeleton protein RodZ
MKEETFRNTEREQNIGERLMRARTAANLTHADISEKLHLPQRVIEALEKNDFTQHPGVTFMRGYLLLYTRCLGLAENEMAEDFAALGLEKHSRLVSFRPPVFRQTHKLLENGLRWLALIIMVVLFTLVILWWRSHRALEVAVNDKKALHALVEVPHHLQNTVISLDKTS